MSILELFEERAGTLVSTDAPSLLLRNLPQGATLIAPYNEGDITASQNWSILFEENGRDLITCNFTHNPDEARIVVDSIIIDEHLGQSGLGRQILSNIVEFSPKMGNGVQHIEADAGEDYGGIAWAAWGFYHDEHSGVREQAQQRLSQLRSLMEPEQFRNVSNLLSDTDNKAALCQIARIKDDIGGYPLNLLLLGETDGHVSLDLHDPVQMALFNQRKDSKPQANSAPPPARVCVHDALEMFGLD